jgi:ABC-type transporter Mla maintaining outer membrane lipid asymmetry ATPase subunit MlaF
MQKRIEHFLSKVIDRIVKILWTEHVILKHIPCGVDIEVQDGETLVIVITGSSGTEKSVLLKSIVGLARAVDINRTIFYVMSLSMRGVLDPR